MKYISPVYVAAFLVCAMGVWGCGQQKTGVITAKINELESRHAKLEEDYRTLQSNHDQHRKKLSQIETQRNALEMEKTELTQQLDGVKSEFTQKLDSVKSERDTLKKQVSDRTQERDAAQTNLLQFSKELQALATRVETALNNNSSSPNASIIPASRRTE